MATYNVEVLRPGVTTGVSRVKRKYTIEELRESVDSLDGVQVTDDTRRPEADTVVGEVTDARYQDGVQCTVEIFDDEIAGRIDEGLMSLAPSMTLESKDEISPVKATDIEFQYLFLTPHVAELVGETERK